MTASDANGAAQRRQFSRIHFDACALLSVGSRTVDCELIDLSLRGALVLCDEDYPKVGDSSRLELTLNDERQIAIEGTIAHREGRRVGIHCERIDLDSMTHLRRIVELNTGDESLLNRELGALLSNPW